MPAKTRKTTKPRRVAIDPSKVGCAAKNGARKNASVARRTRSRVRNIACINPYGMKELAQDEADHLKKLGFSTTVRQVGRSHQVATTAWKRGVSPTKVLIVTEFSSASKLGANIKITVADGWSHALIWDGKISNLDQVVGITKAKAGRFYVATKKDAIVARKNPAKRKIRAKKPVEYDYTKVERIFKELVKTASKKCPELKATGLRVNPKKRKLIDSASVNGVGIVEISPKFSQKRVAQMRHKLAVELTKLAQRFGHKRYSAKELCGVSPPKPMRVRKGA